MLPEINQIAGYLVFRYYLKRCVLLKTSVISARSRPALKANNDARICREIFSLKRRDKGDVAGL